MEPLAPELEAAICGRWIHHYLVIGEVDLFTNADYNRRLRQKQDALQQACAERNWETIVWLHERPYRVVGLLTCIRLGLKGCEYWKTLRQVWMDSENVFQNKKFWIDAWSYKTPGREAVMTEDERTALSGMPELVEVWRGAGRKRYANGLSWTTNRAQAEWFAHRYPSNEPVLVRGLVRRQDVLAFFIEREEDEIVALRVKVQEVMNLGPLRS